MRPMDGTPARSAPRACPPNCGRKSRMRIGRSCRRPAFVSDWPLRLWNFEKYHQYIGGSGGAGVGYGLPASVGAALANKKYGRLSVNIQNDGDLMYAPGALWTAAHHHIPLLTRDAQQSRLSSGGDAHPAHGQPAQSRHDARVDRHHAAGPESSTTPKWRGHGRARAGADHRSEGSGSGAASARSKW